MTFTFVDVILIAIVIVFAVYGLIMGLIQGIGALVGLAFGFWAAIRYFDSFGDWLTPIFLGHSVWAHIIAFLLIFVLANRLIGLIFWFIDKVFHVISIIPFLKSINHLGGLVLGIAEGILFCGLILGFILGYFGDVSWIKEHFAVSLVANWLTIGAGYVKTGLTSAVLYLLAKS